MQASKIPFFSLQVQNGDGSADIITVLPLFFPLFKSRRIHSTPPEAKLEILWEVSSKHVNMASHKILC